jgi:hypothetical protein
MKAIFVVILLIVSTSLFAQESIEEGVLVDSSGQVIENEQATVVTRVEKVITHDRMIVINPFKFLYFYNLSYYQIVNGNLAIGFGFQVPTVSRVDGVGLNFEFRLYPGNRALHGLFVAPSISYNSFITKFKISSFSVGLTGGWQLFWIDPFALGVEVGVNRYFWSDRADKSDLKNYYGTVPAVRIDLGCGW